MPKLKWLTPALIWLVAAACGASEGRAALARGDYETARRLLQEAVHGAPRDAGAHADLGRTLLALDKPSAALAPLERAHELEPDNPDTLFYLGQANGTVAANSNVFVAGRHGKAARAAFERALAIDPRHERSLRGLIVYSLNAPRLYGGSQQDALALARRLRAVNDYTGRLSEAEVLQDMGKDEQARTLLEALAVQYPDDPRSLVELGFMAQAQDDYDAALDYFNRGRQATADSETARSARAMCLYQAGRTAVFGKRQVDDGIASLREYIELGPHPSDLPGVDWARFRLGELYELADAPDDARAAYRAAAAQSDDRDLKRRTQRKLRRL